MYFKQIISQLSFQIKQKRVCKKECPAFCDCKKMNVLRESDRCCYLVWEEASSGAARRLFLLVGYSNWSSGQNGESFSSQQAKTFCTFRTWLVPLYISVECLYKVEFSLTEHCLNFDQKRKLYHIPLFLDPLIASARWRSQWFVCRGSSWRHPGNTTVRLSTGSLTWTSDWCFKSC